MAAVRVKQGILLGKMKLTDNMYDIPKGFIDRAISRIKAEFFFERNNGEYYPAEHYFIIAAEAIWNSYIRWKNQDSAHNDRVSLTLRDIESGCRRYGIPCFHDGDDLVVKMKNMPYRFILSWISCHGGPVGSDMKYLRDVIWGENMRFSIGALLRFLKWFDNAIPKVREQVEAAADAFGSQFKRALILQAGAEQILEPGLEDIKYRYSFRADEEEEFLDIWIYYESEDGTDLENVIRLSFRYEEYSRNPQFIKNIVRSLAQYEGNISGYMRWATDLSSTGEDFPMVSRKKNAGVCAFYR